MSSFSVEQLHPLTKLLLEKRGVKESEMEDFLYPSYEKHIGDPFGIYGMEKAVNRVVDAIRNEEKIAVYSDYDCDGIPGGVLLREFFDGIGYPVEMYVPHRHNEGYGLHNHAIDILKERGVSLIITVDLAITNIEEVAYAKSVGVDVIVTDHHLPITQNVAEQTRKSAEDAQSQKSKVKNGKGADLKLKTGNLKLETIQIVPDAIAVINSKQDLCTYHDKMLCGCGVAWKLACAILTRLREKHANFHATAEGRRLDADHAEKYDGKQGSFETVLQTVSKLPLGWEKWMLDLVGISTIADMVPLQKENRVLAHFGLKVLRKTKRPGLLHIFNEQRMRPHYLTEDDIAFTIAPRVNAASRMGDPIQAHKMLYERKRELAENYARDLESLNTERKLGVKNIISTLSFDHAAYQNDVVVVGDMSWGPGILGLIAQNIIDETGKPTFVWGMGGEVGSEQYAVSSKILKGSCRSLGDVHVVELMARVGHDVFLGWGGHEGAGGFSLELEKIDALSSALNDAFKHIEKKEIGNGDIQIDTDLRLGDVNETTYKALEVLAPFGEGNPKPLFQFKNIEPVSVRRFGKKSEHLEIMYKIESNSPASASTLRRGEVKAIQFFAGKEVEEKVLPSSESSASPRHTLLAHIEKSYFGGKTELRLRIVDVR